MRSISYRYHGSGTRRHSFRRKDSLVRGGTFDGAQLVQSFPQEPEDFGRAGAVVQGQNEHAGRRELRAPDLADDVHQTGRIDPGFLVELDVEQVRTAVDGLDSSLLGRRLQGGIVDQVSDRLGYRSVAVFQFLRDPVALTRIGGAGNLTIGA